MNCRSLVALLSAIAFVMSAGPSGARPRFGLTGGPQITQLVARSYEVVGRPDVRWTAAGFGGAVAEVPLPGGLALATGIEYGQHADEQRFAATVSGGGSTVTGESRRELRQRVLASPLRLEWLRGPWRLGVGPEVRYLVRADQRWQATPPVALPANLAATRDRVAGPAAQIYENVRLDQWQDATYLFRRWSLAANLAMGREVAVGTHAMRADLRWSEGITHQQLAPGAAQRTRAAQLAFGMLW